MNKQKTMRAGFIAAAALILVGMLFVPAVAAYEAVDGHFDGTYVNTSAGTKVNITYNSVSKVLSIENTSTSTDEAKIGSTPLTFATMFVDVVDRIADTDVVLIEVDPTVNLTAASNAFSNFKKANLNYAGTGAPSNIFGPTKEIYEITCGDSFVNATTDKTSGAVRTLETNYATPGQEVKLFVKPAQNYSLYDWYICDGDKYDSAKLKTPVESYIRKSTAAEDGANVYILTMPGSPIYVEGIFRDSGSTVVSYVWVDADTYVMEIPADFSLKKVGTSVADKMVNITACELMDTAKPLRVTMKSENGYRTISSIVAGSPLAPGTSYFVLKNVKYPDKEAGYMIEAMPYYKAGSFTAVDTTSKEILSTDGLTYDEIAEHVSKGTLKTELRFTLMGLADASAIGKYKDKLTFTVSIA